MARPPMDILLKSSERVEVNALHPNTGLNKAGYIRQAALLHKHPRSSVFIRG
jgi:hypothetical protein